jgi:hypothetical protein
MKLVYKLLEYKFFAYMLIFFCCGIHFTACLVLKHTFHNSSPLAKVVTAYDKIQTIYSREN